MKSPFRDRVLLIAFLIILVAFGVLAGRKIFISRSPVAAPAPSGPQQPPRQLREVILYFGALDGGRLVPEAREIECLGEIDCVRETVQALVDGPVTALAPVIPSHTVVRGVEVEGGTAVVNLSREVIADHPGGSLSELFTIYGLANTLAANFPHIRQVRLLVEGEAVETLKGHVGLLEPVQADFRYGRPPEGAADVEAPASGPVQEEER